MDMARAAAEEAEKGQDNADESGNAQQKERQDQLHRPVKGVLLCFQGLSEGFLIGICHDAAIGYSFALRAPILQAVLNKSKLHFDA